MKMRQPPKGEVWCHVNRLDRTDDKVWAVQYWRGGKPVYHVCANVQLQAPSLTRFFGPRSRKQPRAVIVVPLGTVKVFKSCTVVEYRGVSPNIFFTD